MGLLAAIAFALMAKMIKTQSRRRRTILTLLLPLSAKIHRTLTNNETDAICRKSMRMETGVSDLEQTIEDLWKRVRQTNLYGGRPRNAVSEESVSAAQF